MVARKKGVSPLLDSKENLQGLSREMCFLPEGWDSGKAFTIGGSCWQCLLGKIPQ